MEIENEGECRITYEKYVEEEYKTPEKKKNKLWTTSITLTEKCKMYVSNKEGRSQRAVAMDLGRSFGAVNDLINKAKSKKTLDNQHGLKGRYPKSSTKLTEDHKRFILEWLIQSKHKSSNEVWLHLTSIKG